MDEHSLVLGYRAIDILGLIFCVLLWSLGIDKMTEKSPASMAHIEQPGMVSLASQAETASVQPGQQAPAMDPIQGAQVHTYNVMLVYD